MPVHKVGNQFQWGTYGKLYPTYEQAAKQGRAAYAHGYTGKERTVAKKKRSAAQIRATKKMLAANRAARGKRGPGRPRGSKRARSIARVGGLGFHAKAHINRSRIAHADAVDKAHGLKPTSFLVKMLEKAPKHIVELQRTVAKRLESDARPGHAKRAKHKKKARKAKSGSAPKRRKGRSAAQRRNDKRLGQMARARGKHAKKPRKSKRGPGRPKGSKNKKSHAKKPRKSKRIRTPAQLRNDARLRAKGDRTRLRKQKKWGKKRHKTAHKKSQWQAVTPGFAGVSVFD